MANWFDDVVDLIGWVQWQNRNVPTTQFPERPGSRAHPSPTPLDFSGLADVLGYAFPPLSVVNEIRHSQAFGAAFPRQYSRDPGGDYKNRGAANGPLAPPANVQKPMGRDSAVPEPFPLDYFNSRGYNFGQPTFYNQAHAGIDFMMPSGTPIRAPFAGTVHFVPDHASGGYGNLTVLDFGGGMQLYLGHGLAFNENLRDGQRVNPGDLLMLSDNTGMSTGPHLHFEIRNNGSPIDPTPIVNAIFQPGGVSFEALQRAGIFVDPGSGQPSFITTPDGVKIYANSPEERWYNMIDAVWRKNYGAHAPAWAAQALAGTGVQTVDELDTLMAGLPSGVGDLTIGEYHTAKTNIQQAADKYLGRPIPDSLIKQLAEQGKATPDAVSLWFLSHPASEIPEDDFHAVYDAANKWTQSVWGQPPHPDQVAMIYQQTGGQIEQAEPGIPQQQAMPSGMQRY